MDPITAAAAIGAGTAILGAENDRRQSKAESRERRQAREAYEKQLAEKQARVLGIPVPEMAKVDLPEYQDVGQFTPEEMQALQLQESALAGYQADPALVQQQMDALRQLGVLSQGGLTEGDRLAMQQAQIDSSRANAGRQQAILQEMARRGQAGGGAEMASRLQSAQGASDQAAEASRAAQIQASQRALQALTAQGSMAGQMQSRQFSEAQAIADAKDRIAQANWENRQKIVSGNVGLRNQAGADAAARRQKISGLNTEVAARQAMMPNEQMQQRYQNMLNREQVLGDPSSEPYSMQRSDATNRAQSNRRVFNQYMDAATMGGTGAYRYFGSDDAPAVDTKYDWEGNPVSSTYNNKKAPTIA